MCSSPRGWTDVGCGGVVSSPSLNLRPSQSDEFSPTEAVLQARPAADPALRQVAPLVVEFDRRLRGQVSALVALLGHVGGSVLAAPQVGLDLSIAVVSCRGLRTVLINPRLYEVVSEEAGEWETCLSLPGRRWWIERSDGVVVTAHDPDGHPFHLSVNGRPARALQHAADHLRGRLPAERARTGRNGVPGA